MASPSTSEEIKTLWAALKMIASSKGLCDRSPFYESISQVAVVQQLVPPDMQIKTVQEIGASIGRLDIGNIMAGYDDNKVNISSSIEVVKTEIEIMSKESVDQNLAHVLEYFQKDDNEKSTCVNVILHLHALSQLVSRCDNPLSFHWEALWLNINKIITRVQSSRVTTADGGKLASTLLAAFCDVTRCLLGNSAATTSLHGAEVSICEMLLSSIDLVTGYDILPVFQCLRSFISRRQELFQHTKSSLNDLVRVSLTCLESNSNSELYQMIAQAIVDAFVQNSLVLTDDTDAVEMLCELLDSLLLSTSSQNPAVYYHVAKNMNQIYASIDLVSVDKLRLFLTRFGETLCRISVFGPVNVRSNSQAVLAEQIVQRNPLLQYSAAKVQDFINWQPNLCIEQSRAAAITTLLGCLETLSDSNLATKTSRHLAQMFAAFPQKSLGCFAGSVAHKLKIRYLQLQLLLTKLLDAGGAIALANDLTEDLCSEQLHPSTRMFCEWIIITCYLRFPKQIDYFGREEEIAKRRIASIVSWIAIMVHYILGRAAAVMPTKDLVQLTRAMLARLVAWSSSQNFVVRAWAVASIRKLFASMSCLNQEEAVNSAEPNFGTNILTAVTNFELEGRNFSKTVGKLLDDFYYAVFDPSRDLCLQHVFHTVPKFVGVPSDEFVSATTWDLYANNSQLQVYPTSDVLLQGKSVAVRDAKSHPGTLDTDSNSDNSLMQRKIDLSANQAAGLPDNFRGAGETDVSTRAKAELIVVASLIDRPTNLGGLSRTCEIMGASKLVIGSEQYLSDAQFKNLSVTSHKWIPIEEVSPFNMANYLRKLSEDGYTIVGIEQTTQSDMLNTFTFPTKCALVLGHEKFGIGPEYLPRIDTFVEIPQIGVTRSLNVHVSGAMVIWEWAKQHRFDVS